MAVTAFFLGQGLRDIASGTINLNANTFGAMLTLGASWNQDTNHFRSDVAAEVATGSGYTYGGATITNATITYDTSSNEVRWDFDDPTWTSSSFSCSQMWVFKRRGGTSAADELVLYIEFGGTQTVSSGTFSYVVPSTGAAAITAL